MHAPSTAAMLGQVQLVFTLLNANELSATCQALLAGQDSRHTVLPVRIVSFRWCAKLCCQAHATHNFCALILASAEATVGFFESTPTRMPGRCSSFLPPESGWRHPVAAAVSHTQQLVDCCALSHASCCVCSANQTFTTGLA